MSKAVSSSRAVPWQGWGSVHVPHVLSLLGPPASLEMLLTPEEKPGEKGLSVSLPVTTPGRNLFLLKG